MCVCVGGGVKVGVRAGGDLPEASFVAITRKRLKIKTKARLDQNGFMAKEASDQRP